VVVMRWPVAGIGGEVIRDLMLAAVETRFGAS
jgi:hypothetical protein